MSDPLSPIGAIFGIKYVLITYIFPLLLIIGGTIAHVLEEIKVQGWKGWASALSSGFIAFFAGIVVYTFAVHFYPEYAGGLAGLGGFFGARSITVLVKSLKIAIKEI